MLLIVPLLIRFMILFRQLSHKLLIMKCMDMKAFIHYIELFAMQNKRACMSLQMEKEMILVPQCRLMQLLTLEVLTSGIRK